MALNTIQIRVACYAAAVIRLQSLKRPLEAQEITHTRETIARFLAIELPLSTWHDIWREEYEAALRDLDLTPPWN